MLEGLAELVSDRAAIARFAGWVNAKYETSYPVAFYDPPNVCFRVRPSWVFGLSEDDFTGSPTRWRFQRAPNGSIGAPRPMATERAEPVRRRPRPPQEEPKS